MTLNEFKTELSRLTFEGAKSNLTPVDMLEAYNDECEVLRGTILTQAMRAKETAYEMQNSKGWSTDQGAETGRFTTQTPPDTGWK